MYRVTKLLVAVVLVVCLMQTIQAERDSDNDDFDDAGFDDSGYSSPQNHDTEGTEHNPRNYSPANEDDIDDDDDVDESNNVVKVATEPQPRRFYSSADNIVLPIPMSRQKRSLEARAEKDIEDSVDKSPSEPLIRIKRHLKKRKYYIGPVYTYVKTDKHAHYKWGVKHKVGKHYG